jgi:hypothetical protein
MLTRARKIGTRKTYTLIVDNDNLLYASIPAELIVQVPLRATDAEAENTENTRGVRGLRWRSMLMTGREKKLFAYNLTRTLMSRWVRRTASSRTRTRASGRRLLFFGGLSGLRGLSVGVGIRIHGLCKVKEQRVNASSRWENKRGLTTVMKDETEE